MPQLTTEIRTRIERPARTVIGPFQTTTDQKWRVAVTPFVIAPGSKAPRGTVNHLFQSEADAEMFAALVRVRHRTLSA